MPRTSTLLFARHHGEMPLAMIIGMLLLASVWAAATTGRPSPRWARRAVVPRGYAEWCAVVDAVIGLTVIFLV
ncbi:hypothetical protein AB0B45_35445 [Nonomuraea sp. NPDC049152]|uniref:hypothetical protein n=1 Tax=Nonomuraea sp. NPDC049152 TaxID=3154350 RepID=UPI0033F183AA